MLACCERFGGKLNSISSTKLIAVANTSCCFFLDVQQFIFIDHFIKRPGMQFTLKAQRRRKKEKKLCLTGGLLNLAYSLHVVCLS